MSKRRSPRENAQEEHAQVPGAESRLDGRVPPLSGAAPDGPFASSERAQVRPPNAVERVVPPAFGAAPGSPCAPRTRYRLRLYIAGPGPYANRAKQGLADAAAEVGFDYDLEVIDLCAEPHRALADRVVVTPTLVKISPLPRAFVIGDLSDREKMIAALGGWNLAAR